MNNIQLVSVILPVCNQADHIQKVLGEYVTMLDQLRVGYELLPVINGPQQDTSHELCREMEKTIPCIVTLCVEERGWGRAVRHGLSHAKGDLLCYTNAARTSAKDLLLLLMYGLVHPECVIKASRKIREGIVRRFGSLLYNLECRSLFDLPYWDINGTPKVFSRRLSKLLSLQSNDDIIDLEFHVICRAQNYPMIEVPILSSRRYSGSSTTNWKSAFRMYRGAFQLRTAMKNNERTQESQF